MHFQANRIKSNAFTLANCSDLVHGITKRHLGPGFSAVGRTKAVWGSTNPSGVLIDEGDSEFANAVVVD
jgi:hypothetical protein